MQVYFFLVCGCAPFVESLIFLHWITLVPLSNYLGMLMYIYFWLLYSVPLTYVSLLIPQNLFKIILLGWHWLIKLYKFQVYNSVICHLSIVLCVHHPKSCPSITIYLRRTPPQSLDYWAKVWNEVDWSSIHFQNCFSSSSFHINFRIISSISIKSLDGIWVGIVLNLYMWLEKIDVIILLNLSVYEQST